MALDLKLTPEEIGVFYKNVRNESYAVKVLGSNVIYDSSGRDKVVQHIEIEDARVHDAAKGNKAEGDDSVTPVEISIDTIQKVMYFDDKYEEDEIIKQIVPKLVPIVAKAVDQYIGGWLKDQTGTSFPGFILEESEVDGTVDSWLALKNEQIAAGFDISGFVLDAKTETIVDAANKNQNTTLASYDSRANSLFGAPLYYRSRLATTAGDLGYVLDAEMCKLIIQPSITLELHSPKEDSNLRLQNKYMVYAGIRLGFGAIEGSARKLVSAGS